MYNTEFDTIAAISTALSEGGIGIVRISGPDAFQIAEKVFRKKGRKELENRHCRYGHVYEDDQIIDEALITLFQAPNSYTAENVAELSCHGGVYSIRRVLEAVLKAGARLAEPGEFTKRAFLNGRLSLDQAEAVADVISSSNEAALKNSLEQLSGGLAYKIRELRKRILHETAFIEAALDDPEHIELADYPEQLSDILNTLISELTALADSFRDGRLLKDGIRTAIIGRPNVGKSSLLNALLGMERAIVTEIPGTTRDTLEETINLGGFTLRIVDTAGIRESEDVVERLGVEKAMKEMQTADLILMLLDASAGYTKEDEEILKRLDLYPEAKKMIIWNKSDLKEAPAYPDGLKISAKTGINMEQIKKYVSDIIFDGKAKSIDSSIIITNLRHSEAINNAIFALKRVISSIEDGMPEDFFTVDLLDAYHELGGIIGEEVGEDLIDEIFSGFCMGK